MDTHAEHGLNIEELLAQLERLVTMHDGLPDEDTPAGRLMRDFLANNWTSCRDGLLKKTDRIRVHPEPSPHPSRFEFEIDLPYKSRPEHDGPVQLMPPPVRGRIMYRPDLFANADLPPVAVQLDPSLRYLHPNVSRQSYVCLGELPHEPFPLDALLENHLFPILSYQNRRPAHPANIDAARYFATDPEAMSGLESVAPLY